MNFDLKKLVRNGINQLNPADGGKTWKNPVGNQKPALQRPVRQNNLPNGARLGRDNFSGSRLPIWTPDSDSNEFNATPLQKGYRPMDNEMKQLAGRTNTVFQSTPKFQDIIKRSQPAFKAPAKSTALKNSNGAAATYSIGNDKRSPFIPFNEYVNSNNINLDEKYATPNILAHEALHTAWQTDPSTRQKFAKAYNTGATPKMKDYLRQRTGGYTDNAGANFDDYNQLPVSMQTEAHSYLSEYPMTSRDRLTPQLEQYYSQYMKPNEVRDVYDLKLEIADSLDGYRQRGEAYAEEFGPPKRPAPRRTTKKQSRRKKR